jgi:hypothetical protein
MATLTSPARSALAWERILPWHLRLPAVPSFSRTRRLRTTFSRFQSSYPERLRVPRIAQPSIWRDIIPQSWRASAGSAKSKKAGITHSYFIWIFILIGSQAMRIMNVKTESEKGYRLADIKLRQLQEVIEKLERGEDVDVEKVLGTDDETSEQEWEEALRELESEERLWQNNRSRRRAEVHKKIHEEVILDRPPTEQGTDEKDQKNESDGSNSLFPPLKTAPTAPGFY